MAPFTNFSKHALLRIKQRTQLNHFEIAEILDNDLAVDVGTVAVFDKKHWLFYSEKNDCCFVAIQSSLTGTIITVLPIDYHENLAWKIEEELLEQAAKKIKSHEPKVAKSSVTPPTVIHVKMHYICEKRGYTKTTPLTKFKAIDYSSDISRVLSDESLDSVIEQQCGQKGIDIEDVVGISASLGTQQIRIDWET